VSWDSGLTRGPPGAMSGDEMLRMMETEEGLTGPVHLGNPGEFANLELAEKVLGLVGGRSRLVHAPLPPDDPKQRQPDIGLARSKLGWTPKVHLEDGPKETIASFRRTLDR